MFFFLTQKKKSEDVSISTVLNFNSNRIFVWLFWTFRTLISCLFRFSCKKKTFTRNRGCFSPHLFFSFLVIVFAPHSGCSNRFNFHKYFPIINNFPIDLVDSPFSVGGLLPNKLEINCVKFKVGHGYSIHVT